jgi:hypothetical protein
MARPAVVEKEIQHEVTLNLSPLVAPHRKKGRLSLRIERMPQGARLSHGTRNNDGTWSLQSDELDDLQYLSVEPELKEHKITVRIISLANGSTLASFDHPIVPGGEKPAALASLPAGSLDELTALRRELATAKDALAARDAELADRLASAASEAANQFQQTLAKAETAWSTSEASRLAAVQEQWQEKFAEALVDVEEEQSRKYAAQIHELNAKIDDLHTSLKERDAAIAHAKDADTAERAKGDTATRAAHTKIAELEASLAERETALARAVAAASAAKRDGEIALAKAEAAWKDAEAERIAAAEAQWREASAHALAEAQADADTLREQGAATDPDLLEHFTALQAAVAERDAALERAQATADQLRAEADERLAKAQTKWAAAEATRFTAAEAAWQKKLDAATAARPSPIAAAATDAEVRTLREKLAAVQAKLDLREQAVAKAANLANEERMRWQKEAQDAIVKAARERKADEAARLATAQAEWSRQAARDLALATSRAEAAEAALTQVRMRTKNDTQLHTELAALRSALAVRESELASLRHHEEQEETAETDATTAKAARRALPTRDLLTAAAIGVAAVALWPQVSAAIWGPAPAPAKPAAPVEAVAIPVQPANPIVALGKETKLRKTPTPAAAVVVKLKAATKLEVLARHGDWAKVREVDVPPKGKAAEGWVRASFLKFTAEEAPAK